MSNKLQGMAWSLPLPANAKLVLVALADAASDDEGVCWIGNHLLRAKASVKRTSLTYILSAFETMGILRRDPRYKENGGQSSSFKYLTIPLVEKKEEGAFLEKYNMAYQAARVSKKTPCHSVTGGEGSSSDTGVVTQSDIPHVTQSDHQEPLVEPSIEFEEEESCEVEIVINSPSLPPLVVPSELRHLDRMVVEEAFDRMIFKNAKFSRAKYRVKAQNGLAAGEPGWISELSEFVKQIKITSEKPWERDKRLKRERGEVTQMALLNCGFTNPGEAYAAAREGEQDDF